jgi:hypothetical protein
VSSGRRLQSRRVSQIPKNQCPWLEHLSAGSCNRRVLASLLSLRERKYVHPPAHEFHQMFIWHHRKDVWVELVDPNDPVRSTCPRSLLYILPLPSVSLIIPAQDSTMRTYIVDPWLKETVCRLLLHGLIMFDIDSKSVIQTRVKFLKGRHPPPSPGLALSFRRIKQKFPRVRSTSRSLPHRLSVTNILLIIMIVSDCRRFGDTFGKRIHGQVEGKVPIISCNFQSPI